MKRNESASVWRRADQYLGPLAIEETRLQQLLERIDRMDFASHRRGVQARIDLGGSLDAPCASLGDDGVAVLRAEGVLTKYGSSLSEAGSMVRMRQLVRQWADDPAVKGLLLVLDTPGGTVSGTVDLADEIAAFGKLKPTVAYIEDLGASAGYWIASQCLTVCANRGAQVGSVGCYSVLVDSSAKAAKGGVVVHVLRSAKFKGVGEQGAEISDEQLAAAQETPDKIHAMFVAAVASGRGLNRTAVKAFADGRCYLAADAKALGMIDHVCTLDEAHALVLGAAGANDPTTSGAPSMTTRPQASRPAPRGASSTAGKPRANGAPAPAPAAPPAPPAATEEEDEQAAAPPPPADDENAPPPPPPAPEEDEEEQVAAPAAAPVPAPAAKPSARAASVADIKAKYPEASDTFIVGCIQQGLSCGQLNAAIINDLRAKAAQVSAKQPPRAASVPPLRHGGAAASHGAPPATVAAEFERRVKAEMETGKNRSSAISAVAKADPALHESYIEEARAAHVAKLRR